MNGIKSNNLLVDLYPNVTAELIESIQTELKYMEEALRQSEARYRAIVEDRPELIARFLSDGTVTFANEAYCRYFQTSREEIVGKPYEPVIFKDDRELVARLINSINIENPTVVIENRVLVSGELRWTQWNNRGLFDRDGHLVEFQAIGRDISQLKQVEHESIGQNEADRVTLNSVGNGVITTNAAGMVEYINPVAENITGWNSENARGLPLKEVFQVIDEITCKPVANPMETGLRDGHIAGMSDRAVLLARNGSAIAIDDSVAPIYDREGRIIGVVIVFYDVSQTRHLSRQLCWQASHDSLTGLLNRREFERRVEQALHSAKSDDDEHSLCFLDLDRFKIVNDACGHAAGDELLRQITDLLQSLIRKSDVLARLGGDEFGLLLERCPLEQGIRVANNLRERVEAFRFVWQEQIFNIGVSIGLTRVDRNSETLTNLLNAADAACYSAKNRGRNRVQVFESDDRELLQQQGEMQWAPRIMKALEDNSFCLYCQPIAAVSGGQEDSEHYEILLRLRDERGNLVLPMAFIPAAERYNLMHSIDRWVIRTLFENWLPAQDAKPRIFAINLSSASINDDCFIDFLHEQFALHQIPTQQICFEITETIAISNLTKANQFIRSLKQLGCLFSLDDFGKGMSSFAYLKNLPVNYIKIDGGFIRNIIDDPVDNVMVEAITRIGQVMSIRTIAEFVENEEILAKIEALGIDYVQGYQIDKPRPLLLNR